MSGHLACQLCLRALCGDSKKQRLDESFWNIGGPEILATVEPPARFGQTPSQKTSGQPPSHRPAKYPITMSADLGTCSPVHCTCLRCKWRLASRPTWHKSHTEGRQRQQSNQSIGNKQPQSCGAHTYCRLHRSPTPTTGSASCELQTAAPGHGPNLPLPTAHCPLLFPPGGLVCTFARFVLTACCRRDIGTLPIGLG